MTMRTGRIIWKLLCLATLFMAIKTALQVAFTYSLQKMQQESREPLLEIIDPPMRKEEVMVQVCTR